MKTRNGKYVLTDQIKDGAEKVVHLDSTDDLTLKGLARRQASIKIDYHGWYACTVDGIKTLYILN